MNNKGENMTNLKKVGLTALAGSLAAVSAQAGELSVSGSASITYVTGETDNSAQSIGQASGFTLSGSGDLDNGWSVSHDIIWGSAGAYSSSGTTITMGSMGSIGTGSALSINGAYDEAYPRAYEEATDGDVSASDAFNDMGAFAGTNALIYNAPALDIAGNSVAIGVEYSPNAGSNVTAGTGQARTDKTGQSIGLGVTITTEMGLTLGAYGATMDDDTAQSTAAGNDAVTDAFDGTWFANYSMGPVSIGYQTTYVDRGIEGTANTNTTTAKTVGQSTGIFEGEAVSIAFNVNDDLSISYTDKEDTYDAQDDASTAIADVTMGTESLQVAYSMGSMSVKAYSTETTNPNFDGNADKRTVTEIALGIAF
jgi:outer membrane protein OmpU